MNIIHCLPTLGREGFGVTTLVNALAASQRKRNHLVHLSTISSPCQLSDGIKGAKVIHQHMIWLGHGAHAQRLAKELNAPLLISPHGALDPWARRNSAWKKSLAWQFFEERRLQRAACLHATSPFEITYFQDLGLRPPIALIPNGIDVAEYPLLIKSAGEPFLIEYPQLRGCRCLLFLSRITPQKGLILLLEAFAAFSRTSAGQDWRLLIAGSDQDGYLKEVGNAVERLDLKSNVVFLPPLYGLQKQQAMACCSAFVLPSLAEGFPMVVLEAMSYGLPVLCTTASPWMELPLKNAGWWVRANAADIALALADMGARDESNLAAMGLNARKLIESRYEMNYLVEQLDALYSWMCGAGPQPACVQCT